MRCRALWVGCAVMLTGCAEKTLHVESDTSWTGSVEQYGAVSGEGNTEIDLSQYGSSICWDLRKTTSAGTLRVYVRDKKVLFFGTDTDGDMKTQEPNGHVTGCT